MTLWGPILAGTVILGVAACGGTELPADPPVCGNSKLPEVHSLWQCGPTLDFTPINSYQGEFADVVQDREDAVVLIDGLCTGTLIEASAGPVVLTAGHCVGLGDRPLLVFNFEDNPDGDPLMTEGSVIEQSLEPDYALIKLDVLPAVTPVLLTTQVTERLAIIQHPRGHPKVIAEGTFLALCNQLVYYTDLDTLVGRLRRWRAQPPGLPAGRPHRRRLRRKGPRRQLGLDRGSHCRSVPVPAERRHRRTLRTVPSESIGPPYRPLPPRARRRAWREKSRLRHIRQCPHPPGANAAPRTLPWAAPQEEMAMKNQKRVRLQMTQLEESRKPLGERELSEVELKVIAGGLASQGGTCSMCGDCDA